MEAPEAQVHLGWKRQQQFLRGGHHKPKSIRHCSCRPKPRVGLGDTESAEEGVSGIGNGGRARQEPSIRDQGHPIRTVLNARFVRTNPAGYSQWKPMLNGLSGGETEPESLLPPRKLDRKMAATARGERENEADADESRNVSHHHLTGAIRQMAKRFMPARSARSSTGHYESRTDLNQGEGRSPQPPNAPATPMKPPIRVGVNPDRVKTRPPITEGRQVWYAEPLANGHGSEGSRPVG